MAPIQFLFASAIVFSAAVAAPIDTNYVGAGKVGASLPSKHQSEPMRMANPSMSSAPVMKVDTQAMKLVAEKAVQTPPSGRQSPGVFHMLDKLPIKREEKEGMALPQLDEITDLLTSANSVPKREGESLPEALKETENVEDFVASLPVKRDGNVILEGLGKLDSVLQGTPTRETEKSKAHGETYAEKGLKGFKGWMDHDSMKKQKAPDVPSAADRRGLSNVAKRADPVRNLLNSILVKRDTEGATAKAHHETYFERTVKQIQKWVHNGEEGKTSSAVKRDSPADTITNLIGSILAKRGQMATDKSMVDAIAKRDTGGAASEAQKTYIEKTLEGFEGLIYHGSKDKEAELPEVESATESLGLAKGPKDTSPTDPITSLLGSILAKREQMATDESMVDAIAKRDIDDAITTASETLNGIAKRNGLDSADTLNNGLNIRQLDILSTLETNTLSNAGNMAGDLGKAAAGKHRRGNGDAGSVAADVAEGEQTLQDTTADVGGHLDKRQVPPISGADAFDVLKGVVRHPDVALTPVMDGVLLGGKSLKDMSPQ
uniref:Uncharacterized protein n=1 Tax=Talaromyces marneffei PM1 TaxID=1077442 RepID=A0A093VB54_TALMA